MNLKIIIRNLVRSRLYAAIIVISLAIGIACVNLIGLFVNREFHADAFQKNRNRIYALLADDPYFKDGKMYYIRYGAAEYMKRNYPEIEDFCRISNASPSKVTVGKNDFFDDKLIVASTSNFFSFFSYQLLSNRPEHVLETEQDIVISENLAIKYFGTTDAVGQSIILPNGDKKMEMVVSAVFRKPKESTQLNFDMVRLIGEVDSRCYILVKPGTNIKQLEEKFDRDKASIPIVHTGSPGTHYLKDMLAAYFDTSRGQTIERCRNKTDLKIAWVIAAMIFSVALFNYIGLINNRLFEKTREFSIRRINGGSRASIITNLLSETFVLITTAFLLSFPVINLAMPFFNRLTSSSVSFQYIFSGHNVVFLTLVPLLIVLATFLFTLLRIGKGVPVETLKPGKIQPVGKAYVPAFNIAQLAISVMLITSSAVIMKQIQYITNKDIGINKEVIEIKIPVQHKDIANSFRAELEKYPSIEMVSTSNASPVLEHFMLLLMYDQNGTQQQYTPSVFVGDQHFTKTLGVKIIDGEDFSENAESNINKCIINQSLAKLFADRSLLGKALPGDDRMTVIGISEDFHYSSLNQYIEPGYIAFGNDGYHLLVKPESGNAAKARSVIADTWKQLIQDYPLNIESVEDRYAWMHRENENYAKLIGSCCIISIFLSMMGLFAVSLYNSQRRIKEIGIRRVNGARIVEVLTMLNKDFAKWIFVAFVIACPITWYAMHKWLQNFAYKTELSWWVFCTAGTLAATIVLLTVSWQSWKASTRNPVEALRYE